MRAALLLALPLLVGAAEPVSTNRGVYTAAQAADGAKVYAASCAMCHGETLAGTFDVPPLNGRFVANWAGAGMDRMVDYVSTAMPLYAPGSLSAEDNAKVVAYMLQQNGAPAGSTPLPADPAALQAIRFDAPPLRR